MHNPVVCFIVGLLAAAGIVVGFWLPGIAIYRYAEKDWPWNDRDVFAGMFGTLVLGIIIVGGTWLAGTLFTALGCKILGV